MPPVSLLGCPAVKPALCRRLFPQDLVFLLRSGQGAHLLGYKFWHPRWNPKSCLDNCSWLLGPASGVGSRHPVSAAAYATLPRRRILRTSALAQRPQPLAHCRFISAERKAPEQGLFWVSQYRGLKPVFSPHYVSRVAIRPWLKTHQLLP